MSISDPLISEANPGCGEGVADSEGARKNLAVIIASAGREKTNKYAVAEADLTLLPFFVVHPCTLNDVFAQSPAKLEPIEILISAGMFGHCF